uniref:Uncharacterized protein n=1 Tax=Nicotiana tabacum TaxID=4097 RepID=A0A1S4DH53_TOBAC|nr:uncharacterized protein LOC104092371 [Nicotiana tomentosiformis]XP_016512695.1 PREDICTED: uncharacterized protein LOC107829739 [Nicotiana tabacum]
MEAKARTEIVELGTVVQPQPIEMPDNEERSVIEAARPNLTKMIQAILKPDITGHFELKQYMKLKKSEKTSIARPPPPFPQRLKKKSDDRMFNKVFDMLSQIQLNLPLIDVLREISKYAKYIKDIMANKRRLTEFEIMALTEEYTSGIQRKLPQKLKDPRSFTIPVRIGEVDMGRALCDLGASII